MEFFGAEVWAARPAEQRCALDFLCGNHTRNLPPNAFNELFESWLNEELGDSFEMCTTASGLNSRLEKSGTALLRSMCKLTSTGFGAYAKGDGDEFHDMLESDENYFAVEPIGRVELSKRQDWCLEACWKFFALVDSILKYTDTTRRLGSNVLRDSVFQRLELLHFQAYIHAGAAMWDICWEELRTLANSSSVELNPLQLNCIYDELWKVGVLLQSEEAFDFLAENYRPWAEVNDLAGWYAKRRSCARSNKRREMLRAYSSRGDADKFTPILKQVLAIGGDAIHVSLKRTMGDFLEVTNGSRAESKLEPWMKARAMLLLSHNNPAERPFALMKFLDHLFPTMSLNNLSNASHALVNGTFALASPKPKTQKGAAEATSSQTCAGAAVLANSRLKRAVSVVASVRMRSAGTVTTQRREEYAADIVANAEHRQEHRARQLAEHMQLAASRAQKKDTAHSIELITSVDNLRVHLLAKISKSARMVFLSQQFDARMTGRATHFTYSRAAIGDEYRIIKHKAKPLKKSPRDNEDSLSYLTRLVELMITSDVKEGRYTAARLEEAQATEVIIARDLPVISKVYTASYSVALKEEAKEEAKALMAVDGDPVLVKLMEKYVGAVFLDADDGNTYMVRVVQYDEKRSRKYYEATCVKVEQSEGGTWAVPSSSFVSGSEVLRDQLLVGYALMDLSEPNAPVLFSDVDEMISAHNSRGLAVQKGPVGLGGSNKRQKRGQVNRS